MKPPGFWTVVYDSRVMMHLVFGLRLANSLRSYKHLVGEGLQRDEAYRLADDLNLVRDVDSE
jgi:hypothetical protein